MIKAVVCEIEKYATHDGPGIRTIVFLKGCPLRCIWCSNPETQRKENELYYNENKCISCKRCIGSCTEGALSFNDNRIVAYKNKCNACGTCVKICPMGALNLVGKDMTLDEVFEEVMQDRIFYQQSGGGVTISGGEVLMHEEFVVQLLRRLKEDYINTAIETSGFGDWKSLNNIASYADLIMFDIKHTDSDIHKDLTGVDNKIILDNLNKLSKMHKNIIIRIPVITGINESKENIQKTAEIAKEFGINEIHLLPYHSLAKQKYKQLSKKYELETLKNLNESDVEYLKVLVESFGLKCVIGG